jgi:hypothetical protein
MGIDRSQAFLDVVAVLLHMPCDEKVHGSPIIGAQIPTLNQMIGHGAGLVVGPRLKGSDELPLVNQAILQREHREEQVSRSVVGMGHVGQLLREEGQTRDVKYGGSRIAV